MNEFIREFNNEQLRQWINLNLHFGEEYSHLFVMNHINGESFLNLKLSDLKEMGIKIVGHRLNFFGLIRSERKKLNLPTEQNF